MAKNKKFEAIKQITAIIKKYNNDPKREGDQIEVLIMSGSKTITLAKFYHDVMKRFDKQDKFNEQQLQFNKWVVKYLGDLVRINKLKDPNKKK